MQRFGVITTFAILACMSTPTVAQQAIHPDDESGVFTMILEDRHAIDLNDNLNARLPVISIDELSALRASGIDPSWISQRFSIPQFNPTIRRVTQEDHPLTIENWATHHSDNRGVALNDSLRFKVGRTTDLIDGNIAGSSGGLGPNSDDAHISSIAQSEGEYDLYDLSLQWDAIDAGPVTLSLLSGLKAIESNIAMRVKDGNGNSSIDSEHRVTALPMVGSGVSWKISDDFSIRGSAMTHPIESGDALIDFNAATDLRITRNVALVAGYRIIRSTFDVGDVSTELTQEGLFARLQISF